MTIPLKLPWRYAAGFVVCGLACFFAKALIGEHAPGWVPNDQAAWLWDVGSDLLGLFGALLIGAAGLSGIVERVLRPEWIKQTQDIAYVSCQGAVDELATIGVGCIELAQPGRTPEDDFRLFHGRFSLPYHDGDLQHEAAQLAELTAKVPENAAAADALAETARWLAPLLLMHAQRSATALEAVARYRPDHARQAITAGGNITHETRELERYATANPPDTKLVASSNEVLFERVGESLGVLMEVYAEDERVIDPGGRWGMIGKARLLRPDDTHTDH